MKESGFDVVGGTWHAIFGPAHMPAAIVAKLNGAIDAFLHKPETRRRFNEVGYRAFGGPPARVSEWVAQERAKWATDHRRYEFQSAEIAPIAAT